LLFYSPPRSAVPLPSIVLAAQSPNIVTAAECYLALGLSVLPLAGKMPLVRWSEYQQRRPRPDELQRWALRGMFQNVGIVCGAVSGNLIVLDFDLSEVYWAFQSDFPDLATTYTVATGGGGWHVYLRVDVLLPSLRGKGVELRATGSQVAAPPSVHPDTDRSYQVVRPLDIQHVPSLAELQGWVRPALKTSRRMSSIQNLNKGSITMTINAELISKIAARLREMGYSKKDSWLNGPCLYAERHTHSDRKASFGFNIRTGYGNCFRCGSLLAKDIASKLEIS